MRLPVVVKRSLPHARLGGLIHLGDDVTLARKKSLRTYVSGLGISFPPLYWRPSAKVSRPVDSQA